MPVTVYRSTDPGAFPLAGGPSSLLAVLDACLVNGYSGPSAAPLAAIGPGGQPGGVVIAGTTKAANTFTLTSGITASRLRVLFLAPPLAGTYRVGLASSLGAGTPVYLAGGTAFVDTVNPSYGYLSVTLPTPVALAAGTTYYAVLEATGGGNTDTVSMNSGTVTNVNIATLGTLQYGSTYASGAGGNSHFVFRIEDPASGTTSKAAAGWTKPYSAANQAVYRPGSGAQHFFHVDDNGPGVGGSREAQIRGSETATAFQTGTGFFPTVAQVALASGLVIRKASTTTGSGPGWIVIADDRTCYLFVLTADVAGTYASAAFGEFYSLMTVSDLYRSFVIGRTALNSGTAAADNLPLVAVSVTGSAVLGHYMPRTYTGLGTAQTFTKWGDSARSGAPSTIGGSAALAVPEPITGAVHVAPVHLNDVTSAHVRGRMRGFFQLCHFVGPFSDGDTIVGSGAYSGRTFLVIKTAGSNGGYCMDITGSWETN